MDSKMSKTEAFFNAINEESMKNRVDIITEANRMKAQATEEATAEAKKLYNEKVALEKAKINRKAGTVISAKEKEYRLKILEKRNSITDRVFESAQNQLIQFTQNADYKEYLKKNLIHVLSVCKDKSVTVFLKPDDMKYSDELKSSVKNECEFVSDDSIKIGGIKCRCSSLNLIIDDTISRRLDEQREWFYENSGLNI